MPRPIRQLPWLAATVATGALLLVGCTATVAPDAAPDATLAAATPTPMGTPDTERANIVVIDAGGTLVSTAEDRISYQHYADPIDGGVRTIVEDLYPELEEVANVSVVEADASLGWSAAVTDDTLYSVSRTIDAQLADPEVDGVVVTAGTNVLEEDAYFFDLTVQSPKPVVVTGAMHQYGTFTYDGYTNVFSAIRVAASAKTTCFGTVVVMNDRIFAAREVTKTDGYRMDTFESGAYGALGVVNESIVRTLHGPSAGDGVRHGGVDHALRPVDGGGIGSRRRRDRQRLCRRVGRDHHRGCRRRRGNRDRGTRSG